MNLGIPHRVTPLTRRDWLLHAGAGFGALALGDLLARDAAAGAGANPSPGTSTAPWRPPGAAGGGPAPQQHFPPRGGAGPPRRPPPPRALKAGYPAGGRGPRAAVGVETEV